MTKFVRTTGGLLQLKEKQVTKADYDRVMRFAATLVDAGHMRGAQKVDPQFPQAGGGVQNFQLRSKTAQVIATPKRKLMDLQSFPPDVFLRK